MTTLTKLNNSTIIDVDFFTAKKNWPHITIVNTRVFTRPSKYRHTKTSQAHEDWTKMEQLLWGARNRTSHSLQRWTKGDWSGHWIRCSKTFSSMIFNGLFYKMISVRKKRSILVCILWGPYFLKNFFFCEIFFYFWGGGERPANLNILQKQWMRFLCLQFYKIEILNVTKILLKESFNKMEFCDGVLKLTQSFLDRPLASTWKWTIQYIQHWSIWVFYKLA